MSLVSVGSQAGWHTHRGNVASRVLEGPFGGFVSLVSHFLDLFARVRAHMRACVRAAAAERLTKPLKLTSTSWGRALLFTDGESLIGAQGVRA